MQPDFLTEKFVDACNAIMPLDAPREPSVVTSGITANPAKPIM